MRQRAITVLVGPAGSGKTVLVTSIYGSKAIRGHFVCRAWISVVHSHHSAPSSSMSSAGICELCKTTTAQLSMGGDEQAIPLEKLANYLQGMMCLVVVDNVQNEQQWRCIARALPNVQNDNRIIITTTTAVVADSCAEWTDHVHQVTGLVWKDSWLLFCKKAFRTSYGKCPQELVVLAENIVKRCEGIPLAITAAGSLLSRKSQLPSEWMKVHNNLGSEIGSSSRHAMLPPCYGDLHGNLKSCFLYFSTFPEDYTVRRSRLFRLWASEGFIQPSRGKTVEETAEGYLNELIERHLVQACSKSLDGRAKICRVANLIREFAIINSQDENFAVVLIESAKNITKSVEKARRLSIHNFNLEKISKLDLNHVRTLSAFKFKGDAVFPTRMLSKHNFKLLRVLDLQSAPLEIFPESITKLKLLKYLSLRHTNVRVIPTRIQYLGHLEYLDLKHTQVTALPKEICNLIRLRHLLVNCPRQGNPSTFNSILGANIDEGAIGDLQHLQRLTLIKAKSCQLFFEGLGHLEQLEKLGLIELQTKDGNCLSESIQKMQYLSVLHLRSASVDEYLNLDYITEVSSNLRRLYLEGPLHRLPIWVNRSLSNIIKVQLKWSKLNDSPVEILQHLPNLMELQMVDAFAGGVLIFESRGFPKLKIMHVENFPQLDTIAVYNQAMPKLQKLILANCLNLKVLPSGIEHLTSLEKLLLYDMPLEFTKGLENYRQDRASVDHIAEIHAFTRDANGSAHLSRNFSPKTYGSKLIS